MRYKNVKDFSEMFQSCGSLEKLDLTNFDTSNAEDMSYMFNFCDYLKELKVSSFKTEKVSNFTGTFSNCNFLTEIIVTGFDTKSLAPHLKVCIKACFEKRFVYIISKMFSR